MILLASPTPPSCDVDELDDVIDYVGCIQFESDSIYITLDDVLLRLDGGRNVGIFRVVLNYTYFYNVIVLLDYKLCVICSVICVVRIDIYGG